MHLDEYLNDSIVFKSIKKFYSQNLVKTTNSDYFKKLILEQTNKNVSWFFGDYLKTKKKIDYTIKKVTKGKDSLSIIIQNKRNFTAPIALYGIKERDIIFRKWIYGILVEKH